MNVGDEPGKPVLRTPKGAFFSRTIRPVEVPQNPIEIHGCFGILSIVSGSKFWFDKNRDHSDTFNLIFRLGL